MAKRKYAFVELHNCKSRAEVSYHFRSDLRDVMESIGYREGEYLVGPESVDEKPSPWRPAKVPVKKLLGINALVRELRKNYGQAFRPCIEKIDFSVRFVKDNNSQVA